MKQVTKYNFSKEAGFGLIEVLVALVVLSIGLLGLINLQIRGHQYSDSARQRSQATFLAYDILDRMRANRDQVINGEYDLTMSTSLSTPATSDICSTTTATCSPDVLAAYDLWEWKNDLSNSLPNADASIAKNSLIATANVYQITIQWNTKALSEADRDTALGTKLTDSIVIESEI